VVEEGRTNMAALSFSHVVKEYKVGKGKVRALDDATFDIDAGKVTVILGPSGSGKSTTLNLIGGMDRLSSGTITVNGKDISNISEKALTDYRRRKIGFVFQFYNLIPSLNAIENISIVEKMTDDALNPAQMLKDVGLENRAKHFPSELSGGELQRLSIARALCKNPDILLCDEPTGALDSATGRTVLELLVDMARNYNKTVVIVTHNASIALCADKVIHLKDGKIERIEMNDNPLRVGEVNW